MPATPRLHCRFKLTTYTKLGNSKGMIGVVAGVRLVLDASKPVNCDSAAMRPMSDELPTPDMPTYLGVPKQNQLFKQHGVAHLRQRHRQPYLMLVQVLQKSTLRRTPVLDTSTALTAAKRQS